MSRRRFLCLHKAHSATQSKRNGRSTGVPRSLVLPLILSHLWCVLPAPGAGKENRAPSVLADAPGLEKRVTYSETKIPLGELVARVAADVGVALTAARDVADEPVAVVVTDFPARELLEQLADLLDYRWSRRQQTERTREQARDGAKKSQGRTPNAQGSTAAFEIWQDLASKQREEGLRQAVHAGVEQPVSPRPARHGRAGEQPG